MAKMLTAGTMHVAVAFGVTYAFTGSLALSLGVTLTEAAINTFVGHALHEAWDRRKERREGRARQTALQAAAG